jgi:indole-3-glycerol phosphate synthase
LPQAEVIIMKSDFMTQILESKQRELDRAVREIPLRTLRNRAEMRQDHRPFLKTLVVPGPFGMNIIAEIKRASPSRGVIREDLDPVAHARAYEAGHAAALSVLTERDFFQGDPENLQQARESTSLPVLRKDFTIAIYQVYESAAMSADALLLIVRSLTRELLRDCLSLCSELGIDGMVEVHSERELETASWAGARLVGINNRDLRTFKTDIANCIRISRYLEPDQVAVAESGIGSRADVERLQEAGLWNCLIGESLVRADDPRGLLLHLLGQESAQADDDALIDGS